MRHINNKLLIVSRTYRLLLAVFLLCTPILAQSDELAVQELTDDQARELVRKQEIEKELSRDLRDNQLRAEAAFSLRTTTTQYNNEHVLYNRLPQSDLPNQNEPTLLQKNQATTIPFDVNQNESVSLILRGSVYDEAITELEWVTPNSKNKIYLNINFLHLGGISDFVENDVRYSVFTMLSSVQSEYYDNVVLPEFSDDSYEYLFYNLEGPELEQSVFEALNALIRYYSANETRLIAQYNNNRKMQKAREEYLNEHPPKTRQRIINFWPVKSENYKQSE